MHCSGSFSLNYAIRQRGRVSPNNAWLHQYPLSAAWICAANLLAEQLKINYTENNAPFNGNSLNYELSSFQNAAEETN